MLVTHLVKLIKQSLLLLGQSLWDEFKPSTILHLALIRSYFFWHWIRSWTTSIANVRLLDEPKFPFFFGALSQINWYLISKLLL